MSSSSSLTSTASARKLNSGSSSLRQVAERLHQPRGVAACCAARPRPGGGRRRARRRRPSGSSSVSRQAAVAVSGERRSCDRLLTPSRRKWSSRRSASHCLRSVASISVESAPVSWPNSSRDGRAAARAAAASAALRRGLARDDASRPRRSARRSGRVTAAMITSAASSVGQRDDRDDQAAAPAARSCCATTRPAVGGQRVAGARPGTGSRPPASSLRITRATHRLGGDHRVGVHALRVVAHHVGHAASGARPPARTGAERDLKPGGSLRRAGAGEHGALRVEQVELACRARTAPGLRSKRADSSGLALVHLEAGRRTWRRRGRGRRWRAGRWSRARSAGRRTARSRATTSAVSGR